MKTYRIKTQFFKNNILASQVENLSDKDLVNNIKGKVDMKKASRIFYHGKNPFLYIDNEGVYNIVARPSYIDSVKTILENIGIFDYVIKTKASVEQELTLDELKQLLRL